MPTKDSASVVGPAGVQQKGQLEAAKLELQRQAEISKDQRERERIASNEKIAGANLGKSISELNKKLAHEQKLTVFEAGIALRTKRDKQGT